MPRSEFRYNQTVIGDCGHPCDGWPQLSGIGGTDPHVICDVCTRDHYGIPDCYNFAVWVRVSKERPADKKPPVKRKPKPKVNKAAAFWEQFLE